MSKYKAVLFDFDGTIINTNDYIINSWRYTSEKVFGEMRFSEEYLISNFGTPLYESMVLAKKDFGIEGYTAEELCNIYREYQRNNRDKLGYPFPGVKEAILELKKTGVLLGIVTSRGNQDTRNALASFGLEDAFDEFVGMEDTTIHKPEPEPCLICCRKLGIDPSEAVMIGDSRVDIECANRAGADSAFVTWSFCTTVDELVGVRKATYIIEKAEQLVDLVK